MATAINKLAATKSLGNVRALTSQARKDSAPGADATKNVQEQIDKFLGMVKDAVAELVTSSSTSTVIDDSSVYINDVPVTF